VTKSSHRPTSPTRKPPVRKLRSVTSSSVVICNTVPPSQAPQDAEREFEARRDDQDPDHRGHEGRNVSHRRSPRPGPPENAARAEDRQTKPVQQQLASPGHLVDQRANLLPCWRGLGIRGRLRGQRLLRPQRNDDLNACGPIRRRHPRRHIQRGGCGRGEFVCPQRVRAGRGRRRRRRLGRCRRRRLRRGRRGGVRRGRIGGLCGGARRYPRRTPRNQPDSQRHQERRSSSHSPPTHSANRHASGGRWSRTFTHGHPSGPRGAAPYGSHERSAYVDSAAGQPQQPRRRVESVAPGQLPARHDECRHGSLCCASCFLQPDCTSDASRTRPSPGGSPRLGRSRYPALTARTPPPEDSAPSTRRYANSR
jgi:hypothetical protein